MKEKVRITLVISTYNWPEALEMVLKSVAQQSVLPHEVIIADDGSGEPTAQLIRKIQEGFVMPLTHLWHPDDGFRRTVILNKAVAAAVGEYIIQVDGDVILHRHFIRDHLDFAERGHYVAGSRVMLDKELSQTMISQGKLEVSPFQKGIRNRLNALRSRWLRRLLGNRYRVSAARVYYVKGCNMAFWKEDFIRVNGYNEAITGWGREDSELAIRLWNAGVGKRYLKFGAPVYHLWHREAPRDREQANTELMDRTMKEKRQWCEKGVDQYL
jgi:glycosyltransferase involved in cell wall biosynthesis